MSLFVRFSLALGQIAWTGVFLLPTELLVSRTYQLALRTPGIWPL